jgi:hypothetical protein
MSDLGGDKPKRAGRERRRYHRRNVVDRQMVTVELGGGRTGILLDLSQKGMAVQPFLPIPAGTELDFHFDLPRGGGRISGKGTVSSATRTGRVGIQFLHLAERSSGHLEDWLKLTRDPFAVPEPAASVPVAQHQSPVSPVASPNDELDTDAALGMIADRARSVTRADGAALIVAGSSSFLCRASSGRAPSPGTPAAADASLTGECLRLGVIVSCNDTRTDPRVNPMACEQLKVRSVLVVPVLIDGHIFGALEVLSSVADGFTEKDVARLEQLADIASGVLANTEVQAELHTT